MSCSQYVYIGPYVAVSKSTKSVTTDSCGHCPKDQLTGFCPDCGVHMPDRFRTSVPQIDFYEDIWGDRLCGWDVTDVDDREIFLTNLTSMGAHISNDTSVVPYPTDTKEDFETEYAKELVQLDELGIEYEVREGIVAYWN